MSESNKIIEEAYVVNDVLHVDVDFQKPCLTEFVKLDLTINKE